MKVFSGGNGSGRAIASEHRLAGIDEAGRGPLAGPVVVAAVILDPRNPVAGITDSKRLSAAQRQRLATQIRDQALAWAVVHAGPEEIDHVNILQATLRAMQEAVVQLPLSPSRALVDGNRCPALACRGEALIGGDGLEPAIGAASILAKVDRDRVMVELDAVWPGYGFARHKGYPTRAHVQALRRLGPTPVHRRSFAPVRDALEAPPLPLAE
ncbi:ribonuclease HII [Aquisalimonas sp.]|uniref:ribonuclease HII n=1 Tax=Aquisalimonas sp. TaxID=1872621 RepID=UPI0025B900C3|nr:ribonuclease HII [Aquisalimonas sp.]